MIGTKAPTGSAWWIAFGARALEQHLGVDHGPASRAFAAIDAAYLDAHHARMTAG